MTSVTRAWSIGLLVLVLLTPPLLKAAALLLRVLRDLTVVAGMSEEAARGIVSNLEPVPRLGRLPPRAAELSAAAGRFQSAAEALASARGDASTRDAG